MTIRTAQPADAAALTSLINRAFVVERFFLEGDRLNLPEVEARLNTGTFLIAEDGPAMAGCVYLEKQGDQAYLGLLSVEPGRQGGGIGRLLMEAAEAYSKRMECRAVYLRIVSLRAELPPFYRRLGYCQTGTAPFPEDVPLKLPCHFIVMSKPLVE